MTNFRGVTRASLATCIAISSLAAHAGTTLVQFNVLNATANLATPFSIGDTLILDTVVTQATGALFQSITFTVGAGVSGVIGGASWEVSTAAGPGPRLVGVNIDIFDAANSVVLSDSFAGVLGGFAISGLSGAISPGTYRLVATGTAVRDAVLDISVSMIPEPATYGLMLAGLGVVGWLSRRRMVSGAAKSFVDYR